jgi:hypothetical protein
MFRSGPYGYTMRNALDFSKSPRRPASNLSKVVNYLRVMDAKGINSVPLSYLQDVLGIDRDKIALRNQRHWNHNFFRLAKLSGMLMVIREKGRQNRYALGPNAKDVVTAPLNFSTFAKV